MAKMRGSEEETTKNGVGGEVAESGMGGGRQDDEWSSKVWSRRPPPW